jgi:hypothetical protein
VPDLRILGQQNNKCMIQLPDGSLDFESAGLEIHVRADVEDETYTIYSGGDILDIDTLGAWQDPGADKVRFALVNADMQWYELHFRNDRFNITGATQVAIGVRYTALVGDPISYRFQLGAPVNVAQIDGSTLAAILLSSSARTMRLAEVDDSVLAPTTTQFETPDITDAELDNYQFRRVFFLSGNIAGQVAGIKNYELVSGKGRFTVTNLTSAPTDGSAFVVA